MDSGFTRRKMMQALGAAAVFPSLTPGAHPLEMHPEGSDTPKICLEAGGGHLAAGTLNEGGMRRVKQLGVDHVLMGGPPIPWKESGIRSVMARLKAGRLSLGNMMIFGFQNTLYGKPGRDEEIEKVIQSVQAAGRAGLPVVEYNFYAHRAMEGYYEETGRAGSGYTGFDYDRMKDLPPLPEEGAHPLDE